MTDNKEANLIDIIDILEKFIKALKKFWLPIIILIVVLAGANFAYAHVTYVPQYQSQATFTVNTQDSALVLYGNSGTQQIEESLPYIMQSQYMKNLVMEDLELNSFPANVELESKELASFFVLKVNASDPQTAYDILQSMIKNCPRASVYVLGKISMEVLDETGVVNTPVNQLDQRMSLLEGACIGVIISVIALLLYVLTNRTIQKEEDLKKYLSTTCLASFPQITFKKRRKKINRAIHIHNDKIGGSFQEAVRTMRIRVLRSMQQMGAKTILVTGSIPEEGKTTVAVNLALSLAEKGHNVLLLDMDLRNPSVRKVLHLKYLSKVGVVDVLKGKHSWDEVIYKVKDWGLTILPGGTATGNPIQLLNSKRLGELMTELKEHFDYIVLDTPPTAMLSDTSAIAKHTDCAVYVVKQDFARVERIVEGMDTLNLAQVPIIGVVLNGMKKVIGRYSNYYYGTGQAYEDINVDNDIKFEDLDEVWEET